MEAARAAEADQKQQVSKLRAQLAEQSYTLQSSQQQLTNSQAGLEKVQHDLAECQARLADAQSQADVGSKAAEADLQRQVESQEAAFQELQQRWEASTQESSSLQRSLDEVGHRRLCASCGAAHSALAQEGSEDQSSAQHISFMCANTFLLNHHPSCVSSK